MVGKEVVEEQPIVPVEDDEVLAPETLSPFLTGRMFVRRTYFGQFDEL